MISLRNKIIHNKTKDGLVHFENYINNENIDTRSFIDKFDLNVFFAAIRDLFLELDKVDPEGAHFFGIKSYIDEVIQ